jgi:hypothetical protein
MLQSFNHIHDRSLSWLGTGTSIKGGDVTHIHDRSLSWLGTGTSIKSGDVTIISY